MPHPGRTGKAHQANRFTTVAIAVVPAIMMLVLIGSFMVIPFLPAKPSPDTVRLGGFALAADISIAPDGRYQVGLQFTDAAGGPASPPSVAVQAVMPGMPTVSVPLQNQSPGSFVGEGSLGMGGRWQFRIRTPDAEAEITPDQRS